MQSPSLVSLGIVYWNNTEYFPRREDCLSKQRFQYCELITINDGSVHSGTKELKQKYSRLELHLESPATNFGFAATNNIVAHLACGKWLVLLNAGVFPQPDWMGALRLASKAHAEIVSFLSQQIQASNLRILDDTGHADHIIGSAWPCYFGYPAQENGKEPYVPVVIVIHIGAVTFGRRSDFHSQRNLVWTFVKHMPPAMLLQYFPAHFIANSIQFAYYALHRWGRVLWKAKVETVRRFAKVWRKRGEIQRRRKASPPKLRKVMEHGLLEPYLLREKLQNSGGTQAVDLCLM